MDIPNTYFEILPKEINYMILYNLEMKDICDILGYDFYERHKLFFESIIKRDFGVNILTELIDTTSMDTMLSLIGEYRIPWYITFLLEFQTRVGDVDKLVKDGLVIDLRLKSDVTVFELKLLGIQTEEIIGKHTSHKIILKENVLSNYTFNIIQNNNDKYLEFYTKKSNPSDIKIVKVTPKIIYNLLFFLNIDTIFTIKDVL